jgi:hypothetical protein
VEKWFAGVLALGALVPGQARADPPTTIVVFGVPAETLSIIDAPVAAPPPVAAPAPVQTPPQAAPCPPAVTVTRRIGGRHERVHMPLLDCGGAPRDEALDALSVLARPRSLEAPPSDEERRAWRESDGDPALLAEGVLRLHPGLLERLQRIAEAFAPHPIEILSGYRPDSPDHSRHHHGRALDLVVSGVSREALRDLAVTFPQTGVGWYPNSVFVHVDVREERAYWVDLSGPGERPRYVRGAEPPAPAGGSDRDDDASILEEIDRARREAMEALQAIQVAMPE